MALVMTAYVMIVMRGGSPDRDGVTVLMRGDNSSTVQWVINCEGEEKEEVRARAMMRMLCALETKVGWCFQVKHVRVVDNMLADGITRWKGQEIQ